MDVLVIPGHFSATYEDSLHHLDDFRLNVDGIPMSIPNLIYYFRQDRNLSKEDSARLRLAAMRRPFRQIYWSGLHIYNLLTRHSFEVGVLNCHDTEDRNRLLLYREIPKCVVLSMTFMNIDAARKIVHDVREHLPDDTYIVAGGSLTWHSYLVWGRSKDPYYHKPDVRNAYFFTADEPVAGINAYIIDAHGERTLVELITRVIGGERPHDLPNTVIDVGKGRKTKWRFNQAIPENFHIADHRISWKDIPRNMLASVVPIQNTYGCPFQCGFCNFSMTKVHTKPMDVLFGELHELATHSFVERVWFTDDNFFLNETKVLEFCERYCEEGLPFEWASFIRASSITSKTVELLKKSKCCLLIVGFESGSQIILKKMRKKDTVSHYREAATLWVKNGIDAEISFIIGYPGETQETVQESIDFVNELPVNNEQVNYLYLFKFNLVPLSAAFENPLREDFELDGSWDDWRHKTMTSEEAYFHLRRFAEESESTVFNYLDPPGKLERREYIRLMRLRDDVARSKLKYANDSPQVEASWQKLEAAIRLHFIREN